jgi:hypothetical protein
MERKLNNIFQSINRIVSFSKDEDLRQGLVDALRRGHINFIELFIEYGVTLDKLTVKDLDYLYSSASVCFY